jgi:hypothetical protein
MASQGQTETGVGLGGSFARTGAFLGASVYSRGMNTYLSGPGKYSLSLLRESTNRMTEKLTTGGPFRSSAAKIMGMQGKEIYEPYRRLGLSTLPYSPVRFGAGLNILGTSRLNTGQMSGLNMMRTIAGENAMNRGYVRKGASEYADRLLGLGTHRAGANIPAWMTKKLGGDVGESVADIVLGMNVNYSGLSAMPKLESTANVLKKVSSWASWRGSIGREVAEKGISELGEKVSLTALGKVIGVAVPQLAPLVIAYEVFETTKMVATGAYKLGEAYYWKIPKAAYQSVNTIATRGAFMSVAGTSFLSQTASNRGRAVQAIQGSKMNARSALGQEAGLLAGHFG